MLRKALVLLAAAPAGIALALGGAGVAQAAPGGFPAGGFQIIGTDSKLCLTYIPGTQYERPDDPATRQYDQQHNQSTFTTDPEVDARPCADGVQQRWTVEDRLLVSSDNSDGRGRFALRTDREDFGYGLGFGRGDGKGLTFGPLKLVGVASIYATKWQTEDGYLFPQGRPDQVATLAKGPFGEPLTMPDRGRDNQHWRFEPVK